MIVTVAQCDACKQVCPEKFLYRRNQEMPWEITDKSALTSIGGQHACTVECATRIVAEQLKKLTATYPLENPNA